MGSAPVRGLVPTHRGGRYDRPGVWYSVIRPLCAKSGRFLRVVLDDDRRRVVDLRGLEDLMHPGDTGQHHREVDLLRSLLARVEVLLRPLPVVLLVLCPVVEEADEVQKRLE